MISPGIVNLGDIPITTAQEYEVDAVTGLEGMAGLDVQFRFSYGGGGVSLTAYLQTSLDQGVTWIDIYVFSALLASKVRAANLRPGGGEIVPTDAAMDPNAVVIPGAVLGDRLRVKAVSVGVYSGQTLLSVRGCVR